MEISSITKVEISSITEVDKMDKNQNLIKKQEKSFYKRDKEEDLLKRKFKKDQEKFQECKIEIKKIAKNDI